MTGVRDLFSDLQPVTGNKSTLSLSAGRCGAAVPQKGSVETKAQTQGKAFPSRCWMQKAIRRSIVAVGSGSVCGERVS